MNMWKSSMFKSMIEGKVVWHIIYTVPSRGLPRPNPTMRFRRIRWDLVEAGRGSSWEGNLYAKQNGEKCLTDFPTG